MDEMDLVIVTGSIVAGGLASLIFNSLIRNGVVNRSKETSNSFRTTPSQMEVEELESLKIEKIILEENMVKIYEAYKTHKLPKLEYDRLRTKYAEDIHNCNERFQSLQASVDITELKELRKDLVSLVEGKIKNIDDKLNRVSSDLPDNRYNKVESAHLDTVTQSKFGKQIRRTAALEHAKIGKLHEEILDAVARMDSVSEDHSSTVSIENNQIQKSIAPERNLKSKSSERDALGNFD
jgi:hypothetical protein